MNLFSGFGSKHILSSPLLFLLHRITFIQSFGSFSFSITPMFSILRYSFYSSSFKWTGYFLWGWIIGISFLLMYIFCFPGKLPIPWNLSEYLFARFSMFSIFLVSFVVTLQVICTSPNCMHSLIPNIAVLFLHI